MGTCGRSPILLRLGAILAFLAYLLAGASLALPGEFRCARCAKHWRTGAVTPGASCPLLHHGHHCHDNQQNTPGHITLCPDGCLRHDGQGGEIPALSKFLSAPGVSKPQWIVLGSLLDADARFALPPFLAPPDPPPSRS